MRDLGRVNGTMLIDVWDAPYGEAESCADESARSQTERYGQTRETCRKAELGRVPTVDSPRCCRCCSLSSPSQQVAPAAATSASALQASKFYSWEP